MGEDDKESSLIRSQKPSGKRPARQSEKGQIVVEYVLLLVVAVSLAILITRFMVNRNPDSPGLVIQTWSRILNTIGSDSADDIRRE